MLRVVRGPPHRLVRSFSAAVDGAYTHLLALRVADGLLHPRMRAIQNEIIQREPSLAPSAMPGRRNHLTLFPLRLPTSDDIEAATVALYTCAPLVRRMYPTQPPHVALEGVGTFGEKVLYAALGERQVAGATGSLGGLVSAISHEFAERGLISSEIQQREWVPHLTLFKTLRGWGRLSKNRSALSPDAYSDILVSGLPDHPLISLDLCGKVGQSRITSFLKVEASVHLSEQMPRRPYARQTRNSRR